MSKHGANQDRLDGSFHYANLFRIKFTERTRMLNSSSKCINEADLFLNSQAGVLAFNAQVAGGDMNREVVGLMGI